jgi:hypothetical protein
LQLAARPAPSLKVACKYSIVSGVSLCARAALAIKTKTSKAAAGLRFTSG